MFLTVKEISEELRVSKWKVWELLTTGKLKGIRIGRQWRVKREELDKYVNGSETTL